MRCYGELGSTQLLISDMTIWLERARHNQSRVKSQEFRRRCNGRIVTDPQPNPGLA